MAENQFQGLVSVFCTISHNFSEKGSKVSRHYCGIIQFYKLKHVSSDGWHSGLIFWKTYGLIFMRL